ncbi:hypothetical protein LNJ08_09225 [Tenacibaculum finnmarkense genomovar ulcerans]|uniref:hypothetical protein n=1 Tax=Tenacibaculum finnmarkense TaxID=2781243 RepID=UPI001E350242|nr:hypothetical protein [Tenacibaculum finnmarkense]MCD8454576.1 hypothetical protein [Tenacibaculum finnmarkense genomovar ulcerans]
MKLYPLKVGSSTVKIKEGDDPQILFLKNVSASATLKTEIVSEIKDNVKVFPKLDLLFLLELQNKVEALRSGRKIKQYLIQSASLLDSSDSSKVDMISEVAIDLMYGGELSIGANEYVLNEIGGLQDLKSEGMSAFSFEGVRKSQFPCVVKSHTFNAERSEQRVDLSVADFIVFDSLKIPSKIEMRINGEKVVRTPETLKILQNDAFGVVGFNEAVPVFGGSRAVVLDVRGVSSLEFEDDSEPREDIKYYSVKTPA